MQDGRSINLAEQIAICLFILAKGASYREAEEQFKHPISSICEYHSKVLDALVTLSADIIIKVLKKLHLNSLQITTRQDIGLILRYKFVNIL